MGVQSSVMISANRRAFLQSVTGGVLGSLGLRAAATVRADAGPLFVGCRVDGRDRHHVTGFDGTGQRRFSLTLPDRGHAMAFHPTKPHMVVFARRPGRFAVVIDDEAGVARHRIDAPAGRHFYGHGVFSPDGRILFATENDVESGQGVIGLYDVGDRYRRVGDYSSHGIGPHEVILMPDGKTLAIANGGIRTHPDLGRAKLNLDSMTPSLVFTDLASGRQLDRTGLAEKQLSIRHLAMLANGRVAVAMQYEGPKHAKVPLVAIHDGETLRTLDAPDGIQHRMRHYAGSVAVDQTGELIAVSAPRGNLVTFWQGRESRYLGAVDIEDGCGVAPADGPRAFILTSGAGAVQHVHPLTGDVTGLDVAGLADTAWDNHLRQRQP